MKKTDGRMVVTKNILNLKNVINARFDVSKIYILLKGVKPSYVVIEDDDCYQKMELSIIKEVISKRRKGNSYTSKVIKDNDKKMILHIERLNTALSRRILEGDKDFELIIDLYSIINKDGYDDVNHSLSKFIAMLLVNEIPIHIILEEERESFISSMADKDSVIRQILRLSFKKIEWKIQFLQRKKSEEIKPLA